LHNIISSGLVPISRHTKRRMAASSRVCRSAKGVHVARLCLYQQFYFDLLAIHPMLCLLSTPLYTEDFIDLFKNSLEIALFCVLFA